VVRRVDAGAWVAVLPPHPAHRAVALDHLEGHAGLLQVDGGAQPRSAGADHQHLEAGGDIDGVVIQELGKAELGGGEGAVLVGHMLAHRGAEHAHDQCVIGLGDCHRAAVAPCRDGFEGCVAHLLLVGGRETAGVVVAQARLALGTVRLVQPVQLTGHLHQHHQQRRDVRYGNRCGERLIVHIGPAGGCRRTVGRRTCAVRCAYPVGSTRLRHLRHRSPSANRPA